MDNKPIAARFGEVVRRLRRERKISQEHFAAMCGIHRTYAGSVERGEKTVTIATAQKIAAALGMKLSALFAELEADSGTISTEAEPTPK